MQFCSDPITAECCLLNGADVEKVHCYVVREAWIDMRKDDWCDGVIAARLKQDCDKKTVTAFVLQWNDTALLQLSIQPTILIS